jgi:predicted RNA binding protein YcfA (HicA-like mRNA interferase family)
MPKLPRISDKQAVGILERLGFRQVRQRGSHVVLRRGDTGCALPLHKELAVGTLRGALRQAGITPEEFVQAFTSR